MKPASSNKAWARSLMAANPISVTLLPVAFAKLVVLGMSCDVLDVHPIIAELDEGNQPKIVAADVQHPPLVLVFEVVQRRKNLSQCLRRIEIAGPKHPVGTIDRLGIVRIGLCCVAERFSGYDVHVVPC